jgi:hypothetical protein
VFVIFETGVTGMLSCVMRGLANGLLLASIKSAYFARKSKVMLAGLAGFRISWPPAMSYFTSSC